MKNQIVKISKSLVKLMAVFFVFTTLSCGGDDNSPSTPSLQEQVIEALSGTSATLDVANEANDFNDANVTDGTISLTTAAAGSGIFSVTSGSLNSYVSSGVFTVNSEGGIEQVVVDAAADSQIGFSDASATINSELTQLTIAFTSAAVGGRTAGIGNWVIVFNL
jgi:hypothetical protein